MADRWLKQDKEIKKLNEDRLFGEFLSNLEKIINSIQPPYVIALMGEWGRGKSSLMNVLADRLKERYKFVKFNSWKYTRAEDLMFVFLNHFGNYITPMYFEQRVAFNIAYLICRLNKGLEKEFLTNPGWKILARLREIRNYAKTLRKITSGITLGVSGIAAVISETQMKKKEEETEKIQKCFEEIVETILETESKDYMIIFIDDLDRVNPEVALKFIEELKALFQNEKAIYILAVDEEILKIALQHKYKLEIHPKDYLEKFVDLFITMPPYSHEKVNAFLNDLLKEYFRNKDVETRNNELVEKILVAFENFTSQITIKKSIILTNPRKLKRVAKKIALFTKLLSDSETILKHDYIQIAPEVLVYFFFLREYYPSFYRYILYNKESPFIMEVINKGKEIIKKNELELAGLSNTKSQSTQDIRKNFGDYATELYEDYAFIFLMANLFKILSEKRQQNWLNSLFTWIKFFDNEISKLGI